jgi:hypothetical protein
MEGQFESQVLFFYKAHENWYTKLPTWTKQMTWHTENVKTDDMAPKK